MSDEYPEAESQQPDPTRIDRLTPIDAEVTVAPGSDLLFEVGVHDPDWDRAGTKWWDHVEIKWFVDGERRWAGYPSVSTNPHLTVQSVSSGTHMITGIVYTEDGAEALGTIAWIVHVESGANRAPSVERVDPAGERVEIQDGGETRNFTLRATDPEGNLHRVLWFSGMCDDPLGQTAVSGDEDDATLTYDAGECGVVGGWSVDQRGVMNSADLSGLTGWDVVTVDDTTTGSEEWRTLTVDGQGSFSRTDYSVSVSGTLEAESGIGWGDTIDGSSAEGFVRAGSDSYQFTGDLETLDVTGGDGVVYVNGDRVDEPEGKTWHTLTIDGTDRTGRSDYTFRVSGDLEAESGIGWGDSIDGSTAEGFVNGGSDTYRFTGELEALDRNGDATVYVDNDEVDEPR